MNWRCWASAWPLAEPEAVEGLQVHQPVGVDVPVQWFFCNVTRHIHTGLNPASSGTNHHETTTAEALRSVVTCLHKTLGSPDDHCGSRTFLILLPKLGDYPNSLLTLAGLVSHLDFCSKWIIYHKDRRSQHQKSSRDLKIYSISTPSLLYWEKCLTSCSGMS